ncbi:hypothetical protein PG997_001573 [Apiospora hydei]|uniref:DUF7726 domain-containing protein n=1 Tax=Apiospora hydei TaxID=1337664 RepID=A0ABR1XED0_9PEZI
MTDVYRLVEDLKSTPGVDDSELTSFLAFYVWEDGNDGPVEKPCLLGSDDKRPKRAAASSPDLNEAEIAAYAETIRARKVRFDTSGNGGGIQMWTGSEWRERCRKIEEQQKVQHLANIMKIANENPSIKNMGEAVNMEKQATALEHIDEGIDMTPHLSGYRDYGVLEPIWHSVFQPGPKDPTPQELKALPSPFYREINYDCDQVRALLKRFVTGSLSRMWDLDKVRRVCGLERPQLIGFLEKSGPEAGSQSQAYHLCWEFFRRREALGLTPFFDKKKADKIFPWHKVKLGPRGAAEETRGLLSSSRRNEHRTLETRGALLSALEAQGVEHCNAHMLAMFDALFGSQT